MTIEEMCLIKTKYLNMIENNPGITYNNLANEMQYLHKPDVLRELIAEGKVTALMKKSDLFGEIYYLFHGNGYKVICT